VKEWFAGPDVGEVDRDAEFSELARTAGVLVPQVVRTVDGSVTDMVDDTMVRVCTWVDLEPRTRELDPAAVGAMVARLHHVGSATAEPVARWFSEGFGPVAWCALLEHLVDEAAPFAADFAPLVGPLIEVESVMEAHASPIICHRDLWADNVLPTSDGRICVIDFENLGPADPSQELAMVLFEFGDDDPVRARSLYSAYLDAGGPARITHPGNFTMLIAEQAHIGHLAASRWVSEGDETERRRLEAWFRELLDDPVTLPRIDRILTALT
jgi:thiamine kinase-like enzyme